LVYNQLILFENNFKKKKKKKSKKQKTRIIADNLILVYTISLKKIHLQLISTLNY